jgi:hypothetical protein
MRLYEPRQIRPRLTGDARKKKQAALKARYEAGESIRALATTDNLAYGTVRNLLVQAGVTLRSRGGARTGGK